MSKLAAQAGHPAYANGNTGDTPKYQHSEFSFAGVAGVPGEGTDRSRQNREFTTIHNLQDSILTKQNGDAKKAPPKDDNTTAPDAAPRIEPISEVSQEHQRSTP